MGYTTIYVKNAITELQEKYLHPEKDKYIVSLCDSILYNEMTLGEQPKMISTKINYIPHNQVHLMSKLKKVTATDRKSNLDTQTEQNKLFPRLTYKLSYPFIKKQDLTDHRLDYTFSNPFNILCINPMAKENDLRNLIIKFTVEINALNLVKNIITQLSKQTIMIIKMVLMPYPTLVIKNHNHGCI